MCSATQPLVSGVLILPYELCEESPFGAKYNTLLKRKPRSAQKVYTYVCYMKCFRTFQEVSVQLVEELF